MNAIPGATLDNTTGLMEIPLSSIPLMQSLNFTIAGQVFAMDVAAQLIPTDENTILGLDPTKQYGVVAPWNPLGDEIGFILGMKFMERYYAVSRGSSLEKRKHIDHFWQVFDTDNNRIGFAQT